MSETWLLYASGIFLTRLIYLPNDDRLGLRWSLLQLAVQILLVFGLYRFNASAIAVMAMLLVVAAGVQWLETLSRIQNGFRLLSLGVLLASPLVVDWGLGSLIGRELFWQPSHSLVIAVFGVLLLANEANYLVRIVFNWCNLVPKLPATAGSESLVDEQEYRAGRVIGMLERGLIFLIVYFTRDLGAVGFILAAKGLIRIRQLRDRQFSEYMLIGTLASVLCAVIVAFSLQSV